MGSILTRRKLIAAAAVATGGSVVGDQSLLFSSAAAAQRQADFADPKTRMSSVMKLFGATDDRLCFGFVDGTYYGVADQRMTPMFGVLAGVFSRFVPRSDGTYDGATLEVAYYTDTHTGEILDKFT